MRRTISFSPGDVKLIDRLANEESISFSAFVRRACKRELKRFTDKTYRANKRQQEKGVNNYS